jgi:AAA15 family ATPase/GTPase
MLTRLEVDGFKSLRDFSIDLEPLTVLLGPNDAGKSNIFEALALSSRLGSRTPEDALKQGRGRALDQFRREGTQVASAIVLSLRGPL